MLPVALIAAFFLTAFTAARAGRLFRCVRGGHMAAMAAQAPNDPRFQPGFERVDASVCAVICLNAYYGYLDNGKKLPSSPEAHLHPDTPPLFMAHGDNDTAVLIEGARHFAERLQHVSSNPVVYVELAGAQHAFDLFHSLRFETVVNAVEVFAAWVRSTQVGSQATS
ncbi:alpha/beta hydrolase [Streptomyces sp. NPDC059866]|uniref:alpha/beta hydrolase n=1 Tax=Streptomyces sp. NPDC059866 TaxID=3346978 RepID=UPI0036592BF3